MGQPMKVEYFDDVRFPTTKFDRPRPVYFRTVEKEESNNNVLLAPPLEVGHNRCH
jgi:hypothetical protein